MPRGGHRTGAGRPKGAKNKPKGEPQPSLLPLQDEPPAQGAPELSTPAATDLTPLAYFVAIMNDPNEPARRRDWAASMAAPYLHTKSAEAMPGKREQAQAAAEEVAKGRFAPRKAPTLVVNNG